MRKSKVITLALLTGTALTLMGCEDEDKNPKLVQNEQECIEKFGDAEACKKATVDAAVEHEKTAPRFSDQKSCEEQFGAAHCQQRVDSNGGGSFFMPMMAGYFMSRMMSGGTNSYSVQSACRNGSGGMFSNGCGPVRNTSGYIPRPGYVPAYAYAGRMGSNGFESNQSFKQSWTGGKVATSRSFSTTTSVSRGGFGGSAHASAGS